jgi:cytoskeletal protein CcmA (bactofilin family)
MNEHTQDLHISGSSEAPGGEYGSISISGAGEIESSVKCDSFHCSGSAEINGDLVAKELRCSGNLEVEGSITVEGNLSSSGNTEVNGDVNCGGALSSSGNLEVEGDLDVGSFRCSGFTEVEGSIQGRDIHISGSLEVTVSIHCSTFECSGNLELEGDLEAETVNLSGSTEISGLLNAEVVNISADAHSEIDDIGGSVIKVLRNKPLTRNQNKTFTAFGGRLIVSMDDDSDDNGDSQPKGGLFAGLGEKLSNLTHPITLSFGNGGLEAETIEGDTVELENTTAEVVRGARVVIGEGCSIDRVEYSESLDALPGTVKEAIKI